MFNLFPNNSNSLSPEFQRAVSFMLSHLADTGADYRALKQDIYQQGAVQKLYFPITPRDIPKESGWRWNQAQAKKLIEICPVKKLTGVICKIVPRRATGSSLSPPKYKLWNFKVSNELGYCFNIIWCEKGKTLERDLTNPHHITIEDFKFLSEFMNPSVAAHFWPAPSIW